MELVQKSVEVVLRGVTSAEIYYGDGASVRMLCLPGACVNRAELTPVGFIFK